MCCVAMTPVTSLADCDVALMKHLPLSADGVWHLRGDKKDCDCLKLTLSLTTVICKSGEKKKKKQMAGDCWLPI